MNVVSGCARLYDGTMKGLAFAMCLGVTLAIMTRISFADPPDESVAAPPDLDAVPAGDGWYCYDGVVLERGEADAEQGACARTKVGCEYSLAGMEKNGKSLHNGGYRVTQRCVSSNRAAVVTFRRIVADQRGYLATPTLAGCEFLRGVLRASPDNDLISTCSPIGDIPLVEFRSESVPAGDGWFCFTWALAERWRTGDCSRTKQACTDFAAKQNERGLGPARCARQVTTFARSVGSRLETYPPGFFFMFMSTLLVPAYCSRV